MRVFAQQTFASSSDVYGYEDDSKRNLPGDLEEARNGFTCPFKNKRVAIHKCYDDYVNDTAYLKKGSPCTNCQVGSKLRDSYAQDESVKPKRNSPRSKTIVLAERLSKEARRL